MKQVAPIAAVLALALTAYSGEADSPSKGADTELTVSTTDKPDASYDAAAVEAAIDMPAVIPTRFHGVWDYVVGTCSPESDMRMEISGNEILFYESSGTVTAIAKEGEDVLVTLAMAGEGENWEEGVRLTLDDEGNQLVALSTRQKKAGDEPWPRKRCAQ